MDINYPLLLDGGLSNQLEAQGVVLSHPLWTAKTLVDAPEKIVAAHRAYLEAGAQCITTSSYQASIGGFVNLGLDRAQAIELFKRTVSLAQEAIRAYRQESGDDSRKYIAASIGPYGASLADGSEYRGNYGVSEAVLRDYHIERLNALAQTGQDFFACETIPSAQEALILSELLADNQTPAWLSFSCRDEAHLCDGSPLADICQKLKDKKEIFAVGVNCSAPQFITPLIGIIRKYCPGKRIVIYPNSGETYDATKKIWHPCETPAEFCQETRHWLRAGADIIGGCCRINPSHIREMADALKQDARAKKALTFASR